MARNRASNEALRQARTIAYYEACLDTDAEVPQDAARELWTHDMNQPFREGEHVSAQLALILERWARDIA